MSNTIYQSRHNGGVSLMPCGVPCKSIKWEWPYKQEKLRKKLSVGCQSITSYTALHKYDIVYDCLYKIYVLFILHMFSQCIHINIVIPFIYTLKINIYIYHYLLKWFCITFRIFYFLDNS